MKKLCGTLLMSLVLAGMAPTGADAALDVGDHYVYVAEAEAVSTNPPSAGLGYLGGCAFQVVHQSDTVNTWAGAVELAAVSTVDGTVVPQLAISVACDFYINDVFQGQVLPAPQLPTVQPQPGVVVGAARFEYAAGIEDVATLCTRVTVFNTALPQRCDTAEITRVPRSPLPEFVAAAVDALNVLIVPLVDPTLCPALKTLAPTVNALPADIVSIDPATGDTFLGDARIWDCPPYGS